MRLIERVAAYIEQESLLEPGQPLVVGVSGGPDSLALLDCLHASGYQPVVAHFDHQIRPDSAADAAFVRSIAESYELPFEVGRPAESSAEKTSEEMARIQRYRFLSEVAKQGGIDRIAVGHTANDQAETVLMHLLRGAGSAGLSGMRPAAQLGAWIQISEATGIVLIRPLLEVWRHETSAYCSELGISALDDPTNQDPQYLRNRLRNELMPELQTYNPRVLDGLLRTAKVMAAEAEAIDELVNRHWNDWVKAPGDGVLALQSNEIAKGPVALQRAALRRAILELAPEMRDVGFEAIERVRQSIKSGKRLTLHGGLELLVMNGEAYLRMRDAPIPLGEMPQLKTKEEQLLAIPFDVELRAGWRLTGAANEKVGGALTGPNHIRMDASEAEKGITLRVPRPGDRIAPIGMSGSIKLSDLFINRKAPRPSREHWPVIMCGEEIIWVPGLHRAELSTGAGDKIHMELLAPIATVN